MTYGEVTAIVVNYNVRDLLLACLKSLAQSQKAGNLDRIIVVDSDSQDESVEAVHRRFPNVETVVVANQGYGAAANAGMKLADTHYLLVLNADTVVPVSSIPILKTYLDAHQHAAIAGPRLRTPSGELQSSRRRFPRRLTPIFESTILQEYFPRNRWTRAYYVEDWPEDQTQEVDWVAGAALMVRREAVAQAGGFDETFRMFAEEVEWCYRFRRHGWRVAYVPEAEIVHHQGASTRQDVPRRQIDFDSSRVELQRRIYGDGSAELVKRALQLGYLAQIAREGVKWALGHKRELRSARMHLYLQALRSGLKVENSEV